MKYGRVKQACLLGENIYPSRRGRYLVVHLKSHYKSQTIIMYGRTRCETTFVINRGELFMYKLSFVENLVYKEIYHLQSYINYLYRNKLFLSATFLLVKT